MPVTSRKSLAAGWLAAAVASSVHGQSATRPDAGSLLQQLQQTQRSPLPQVQQAPAVMPPEMPAKPGLAVTVRHFVFAGNHLLTDARLQQALAPWRDRPLGFADLQSAAAAAAEAYRAEGWVVRAYLPQQEIDGDKVTIQIVEAVLGRVQVTAPPGVRVSPERIRATALSAQASGQALSAEAVDRALLLASDIPGINVRGSLTAGAHDSETDIVLEATPQPLFSGDVALDNTGARSTGAARLALTVSANSLAGLGDQGVANVIHSQGSNYWRAAWSQPLGYRGTRAGTSVSVLNYRVVTAPLAALGLEGDSYVAALNLSHPLVRSREKNLYLNAELDHKHFSNASNSTSTSDYRVDNLTASLSGNLAGSDNGATTASLALSVGRLNLSGSANQAADAAGPRAAGTYEVLRYSANRLVTLTGPWSMYASLTGQTASKNLDTSENFYLGGAGGVRAYPASEAGGSDGQLATLEARYQATQALSLVTFYDWGHVTVNHDNHFSGAAANNSLSLQGAGLSLAWLPPWHAYFRLTWSHRLGSNPNPASSGTDQDGSKVLNRFWLLGDVAF